MGELHRADGRFPILFNDEDGSPLSNRRPRAEPRVYVMESPGSDPEIRLSHLGWAGHLSMGLGHQAGGTTVRDAAGFDALYVAHRRYVVAYCLRRSHRAEAYEAADETFLIAWRRFDEIPSGQERAWLYGVAYRVLGNQYRGESRRLRLGAKLAQVRRQDIAGPEAQAVRCEDDRVLWRAYLRLGPDDQEVLRLAAWEELSHPQIGVALGCSHAAARQRLHRARERLAQEVQRAERRTFALARRRHGD